MGVCASVTNGRDAIAFLETEHADVVLPVAPAAEKAGRYVTWEGRRRPFDLTLTNTGAFALTIAATSIPCTLLLLARGLTPGITEIRGPRPVVALLMLVVVVVAIVVAVILIVGFAVSVIFNMLLLRQVIAPDVFLVRPGGRAAGAPPRALPRRAGGKRSAIGSGAPGRIMVPWCSAGRKSDAHAWVEVYFPGHGWVMFDPTGGNLSQVKPLPSR